MDQLARYTIRFDTLDAASASSAAESLRRTLRDTDPTIQSTLVRTDPEALDFGTAIHVALAAPAIIQLAKGISNWLGRTPSSRVTVIDANGIVVVENISLRDAPRLAKELQERSRERK